MSERDVTPHGDERPDEEGQEFGLRVRQLRERAGMTLAHLSERSGVSRAMLSKVERGEKSPTIGIAKRIAHALGTTLGFLTGTREERRTTFVVRERERPVFRDAETGFEKHILSPVFTGSTAEVVYCRLQAQTSTGLLPPYPPNTEKHVVVVQGELTIVLPGAAHLLRKGDTFFFEADVEQSFENNGARPTAYYIFISRCA